MRIAGYIEHPTYVITVFQMDDKFSVKFEKNLLEQTYKFRSGPYLSGINEIKKIVDDAFLIAVDQAFIAMEKTRLGSLKKVIDAQNEGDSFEEII